jgi:aminoglycoside 6'-N-acetyltransferase I
MHNGDFMNVHILLEADKTEYLRMRQALWPEYDSHAEDLEHYFSKPSYVAIVAERSEGKLCGFIDIGSRSHAEGCETSPVAYIEGWYVDPDLQKQGLGRLLVQAAESWAKTQGYTEIASDTWLDNEESINAHKALGYAEIERLVCFAKCLM